MDLFRQTNQRLEALAHLHSSCIVSFSGGKDSLVVLDLATRFFKTIVPVYFYWVPGLEVIDSRLQIAEERYGLPILRFPHWDFINALREGIYGWESDTQEQLPKLILRDNYNMARQATAIELVLDGCKKGDSRFRKRILQQDKRVNVTSPIAEWKDSLVFAYLKIHQIPMPHVPEGQRMTGIDLKATNLLWLQQHYPDDYRKLIHWFPFAECAYYRQLWFRRTPDQKAKKKVPNPGSRPVLQSNDSPIEDPQRPL